MRLFFSLIMISYSLSCWFTPAKATEISLGLAIPENSREWETVTSIAEEVATSTPGAPKIRLVPAKQEGTEMISRIVSGELDGGLVMLQDFATLQLGPAAYAYSMPFMFSSAEEIDHVRKEMDPKLLAELSTGSYEFVAIMEQSFAYAMSSGTLANPEGWLRNKLWMPAAIPFYDNLATVLQSLGFQTVTLPGKDVSQGLQDQRIDTIITPPAIAVLKQWHRKVTTIYTLPVIYSYGFWVIRDEVLQDFSPEDLQLLHDHVQLLSQEFTRLIRKKTPRAWDVFERWEIKLQAPSSDMKNAWKNWGETARHAMANAYRLPADIEKEILYHLDTFPKNTD